MAIIREDVVSIGFDVERNPFADLTDGINEVKAKLGIMDAAGEGLNDVAKEARAAGDEVENLANGIHAPPGDALSKPLVEAGNAAGVAEGQVAGLRDGMLEVGKEKLTDGVEGLDEGLKAPKTGFKDLLGQAKKISREKLDTGIKQLPPHLQLGIRAGAELGKVLGKAARISFKSVSTGVKSIATHATSAAKSLGQMAVKGSIKGIAVGLAATTAAMGAGAVAAYNLGTAYETSLAKVSTMVDTSLITMDELSGQVMSLSNTTGEGASELNEAVYQALSAGAKSDQVVDLVGTAVKAAKGGFTDTTTAVDGLTSTLNAYGMATSDAEGLANQFLITQNKGKTTFGELASSIGGVAPTAKAAGVGVDQLLAGVASLTANGVGTSEAMTGIKAALSNVIKPSSEAEKMAKSLGLEFNTAALQSKGLVGFLDDVKKATGGDTDKMAKLFGSVEALNTVLTLTSDQGSQLMNDTLNEMATNTGALDAAYETMADTTQESVRRGLNTFKNLGIGIFQSSEGIVSDLTGLFARSGQELYEAFQADGMDGLSEQIGTTLTNVLVTLTGYLPQLVQGGMSIIQSLISGIIQNREQISQSVIAGVTTLLTGLVQLAPQLLTAGVLMLGSILQGLDQQMPNILNAGLTAIQNLCAGLLANAPSIIQSGISIIMQLLNGLIAAAPTILVTGIQLVIMLAQGLIAAIPQLIQTIPTIVSAIITTLMSVDWLKLGLDIIKGIGNGLVQGIKGLFSKGKDAGKEVGDGVAAGLDESTSQLTAAADQTTADATENLKPDTDLLNNYGMQMPAAVASGIDNGAALAEVSAAGLGTATLDAMNEAMAGTAEGTQPILDGLSTSFDGTMTDMNLTADTQMTQLDTAVQAGFSGIVTDAGKFGNDFKDEIERTDLYQSGINIMRGLNNGLKSMRSTVISTARGIGTDLKGAVNGSLDIHSPSGVMEESGENTGLGLIKGMEKLSGKITRTAQGIADRTAVNMSPMRSQYSPESTSSSGTSQTSQVNTWNPVFNLTLNGASASDSNERKVRRWVKEAMKEAMEGMGRTNPRLQEV